MTAVDPFYWWQPKYAEHGLPAIPMVVIGKDKYPLIKGRPDRVGLRGSGQLRERYPEATAFAIALGRRNARNSGITVLDVDTPDEKVLADALDRHGRTPIVVRTGSGNFQALYRHNGEPRSTRPRDGLPIDVLGHGLAVVPASRGGKGHYIFVEGGLDDLDRLPIMRNVEAALGKGQVVDERVAVERARAGARRDTVWRFCMRTARDVDSLEELKAAAHAFANAEIDRNDGHPFTDAEIDREAESAWDKTLAGENWFGRGRCLVFDPAVIESLADPDAFFLLGILRNHHWGRAFTVANGMAAQMPGGSWRRERFAAARRCLEERGIIEMIRPPSSFHGPAVYRFKDAPGARKGGR